jgi:hypothetical protein
MMEEFAAEALFKEEQYEIMSLLGRQGKVWVYSVEDKIEKFKRHRKFVLISTFMLFAFFGS